VAGAAEAGAESTVIYILAHEPSPFRDKDNQEKLFNATACKLNGVEPMSKKGDKKKPVRKD